MELIAHFSHYHLPVSGFLCLCLLPRYHSSGYESLRWRAPLVFCGCPTLSRVTIQACLCLCRRRSNLPPPLEGRWLGGQSPGSQNRNTAHIQKPHHASCTALSRQNGDNAYLRVVICISVAPPVAWHACLTTPDRTGCTACQGPGM